MRDRDEPSTVDDNLNEDALSPGNDPTRIHDVTGGTHAHARRRSDVGEAFLPDPFGNNDDPATTEDEMAQRMAQDYVASALFGHNVGDEISDEEFDEEIGGPFVEERESREFADDIDGNNPPDATREPLPRAIGAEAFSPQIGRKGENTGGRGMAG